MMATAETKRQSRLLGEPADESVRIKTSGRVIRPALAIPNAIVDECRIHADDDGVHIQSVDLANVAMVTIDIYPDAFDEYELRGTDEFMTGWNLSEMTKTLRKARLGKQTDDPVRIDIDGVRSIVEIERTYSQTTAHFADEVLSLDPASVREEPNIPDLKLPAEAEVDVSALIDAVNHIDVHGDEIAFRYDDGDMVLSGGSNEDSPSPNAAAVVFDDIANNDDDERLSSWLSLHYLTDIADGLNNGKVDAVRVVWGDDFPIRFHFQRERDGDVLYDGHYLQAPRIGGDE